MSLVPLSFRTPVGLALAVALLALPLALPAAAGEKASPAAAEELSAHAAFDRLKTLAGTWKGEGHGEGAEGETFPVEHRFEVSANDTVVMETMAPDSEHEMINMYHLDGDELVMTHYCAGGNQPTMRLDRAASSADAYVFAFTGGTNLDPAKDPHIHAGELIFAEDGSIDSVWKSYNEGQPAGKMIFELSRADG